MKLLNKHLTKILLLNVITVYLLSGCQMEQSNDRDSINKLAKIGTMSSGLDNMPDAGDGIDTVKSWAFERIIWAEDNFNNNGFNRYGSTEWWGNEIVYQIQVDRFNNGDVSNDHLNAPANQPEDLSQGDLWDLHQYRHGGDLKGIMDRMDYFVDLGITTLWLTPVLKHDGSYHGYCTSDFSFIDPGFGTNEQFRQLVSMAHSRNIKIVMDIVINHMCDNNTYYDKWPNHYECSDDLNEMNWNGTPGGSWEAGVLAFGNTFFPPLKSQNFFNRCGANSYEDMTGEKSASIYGDFVSTMFDFDTRNHDFQDIFTNLHKYWIAYADVDGFRMDAAKHVTEDFIAYFNTEIKNYANSIGKHNFFIVGEVAASADIIGRKLGKMFSNPYNPDEHGTVPKTLTNRLWQILERYGDFGNYWYGAGSYINHPVQKYPGLTGAYDFAHSGRARGALRNDSGIDAIGKHFSDSYFTTLAAQNDTRLNWNVLEIHDWPRFVEGKHKNNPWKSQLGLSYLSTAQGIPVIYYGQEQGFSGDCHWDKINAGDANEQLKGVCGGHDHTLYRQDMFTSGPWCLGSTVGSINDLANIGHTTMSTWNNWITDPFLDRYNSVYKTARKFNYIRRSCDALRYGSTYFRAGFHDWESISAFSRISGNKEVLVVVNNTSEPVFLDKLQIDGNINNQTGQKYRNLLNGYQYASTGFQDSIAYLNFTNNHQILGNSIQVWVHESNVSAWSDYLETHQCNDYPQWPVGPEPVNQDPTAIINVPASSSITVNIGDTVIFDGSDSFDNDGHIDSFIWSNSDTNSNTTEIYNEVGQFEMQLTVWDNNGAMNSTTVNVNVQDSNNDDWQRTVVFMYGVTIPGQDMFVRGGIDWNYSKNELGIDCGANEEAKWLCAIPIRHLNPAFSESNQFAYDKYLDWYGMESGQDTNELDVEGSPLAWTTNSWPEEWGLKPNYETDGYGETTLNQWGHHYWLLDVEMDCSKTVNGWFELKSYISNGPGWESDINQINTPYLSKNHFAECGKINVFKRSENNPVSIHSFIP